jgi:site-specific recombinase XerD
MEYFVRKAGINVSCHQLRHNADLVTIQDLLGRSLITTTQRYCIVSNGKAQRDYFEAMEEVTQKTPYG